MKDGLPATPSISEYITSTLHSPATAGIDALMFSMSELNRLKDSLDKAGLSLDTDFHPADGIWIDRPQLPVEKAFVHEMKYAEKTHPQK